jgi:hypothetical protein
MLLALGSVGPYISKLSFQYGFSVFFMTLVVRVCSPLMVATAKGSGKPAVHDKPVLCHAVSKETYGRHHAWRGHPRR